METEDLKTCLDCEEELSLSEFGTSRASKDGHNPYCKLCVRRRATNSRNRRRAWKQVMSKHPGVEPASAPPDKSAAPAAPRVVVDNQTLVLWSLREVPKTREGISTETKLHLDAIGDALTGAMLLNKYVASRTDPDDNRMYFLTSSGRAELEPKLEALTPLLKRLLKTEKEDSTAQPHEGHTNLSRVGAQSAGTFS